MHRDQIKNLVYVALGGNLGDVRLAFEQSLQSISCLPVQKLEVSQFYNTAPVSDLPQNDYVNAVCRFQTTMTPHELLFRLQSIQKLMGQEAKPKNYPRKIDLDILFFGQLFVQTPDLQIPHPRWMQRLFVLVPLADLTSSILLPDGRNVNILETIDILTTTSEERVEWTSRSKEYIYG